MKSKEPLFKSRAIYQDLLRQISDGTIPPNSKLPSAIDLAARYGVAKMTLRHALAQLVREGLVVSRPYHGTWVCDPASRKRTKTIGLLVPFTLSNLTHPVFSRLVKGVESILSTEGYTLALELSDMENPHQEEALQSMLKKQEVDGWILSNAISASTRRLFSDLRPPAVIFHVPMPDVSGHLFVPDRRAIEAEIMNHAFEQGYRRPCLVYPRQWDQSQFLAHYQRFHKERGVPDTQVQLFQKSVFGQKLGAEAVCATMTSSQPPDLFICDDDDAAFGVMQALAERGIHPPQVGIIGAGDFLVGDLLDPPLTTIRLPYYQLGREAARLLIDVLNGDSTEAMTRKFSVELVIRGSSCQKGC